MWTPGSEESHESSAERKVTPSSLIRGSHSQRVLQRDGGSSLTFHFLGTFPTWPVREAIVVHVSNGPRASQSLESRIQDAGIEQ